MHSYRTNISFSGAEGALVALGAVADAPFCVRSSVDEFGDA